MNILKYEFWGFLCVHLTPHLSKNSRVQWYIVQHMVDAYFAITPAAKR